MRNKRNRGGIMNVITPFGFGILMLYLAAQLTDGALALVMLGLSAFFFCGGFYYILSNDESAQKKPIQQDDIRMALAFDHMLTNTHFLTDEAILSQFYSLPEEAQLAFWKIASDKNKLFVQYLTSTRNQRP